MERMDMPTLLMYFSICPFRMATIITATVSAATTSHPLSSG
jgi:hypothetical protein